MSLQRKEKIQFGMPFFRGWTAVSLLAFAGAWAADRYWGTQWLLPVVGLLLLLTALLALRMLQLLWDRQQRRRHDFAQLEALLGIQQYLQPGVLLPATRNYAGSPDFLRLLIELLERHRPRVIVEASSGVSSIVISEWLLQHAPDATHYALENEAYYADLTRERIRNPRSHIVHAPLVPYTIAGQEYQWYDLTVLPATAPVEMLVVDGPPYHLNEQARYPVVPLLRDRLAESFTILLDDAARPPEATTARRWAAETGARLEWIDLEKGAAVLTQPAAGETA
jgi:hypothetical protein